MNISVDDSGLIRVLNEVISYSNLEKAMNKGCIYLSDEIRKKAPKDTGALRRSITYEVDATSNGVEGYVYSPLEYAPYVEYGTGIFAEVQGRQDSWRYQDEKGEWHTTNGQTPQPYFRNTCAEKEQRTIEIIKEELVK